MHLHSCTPCWISDLLGSVLINVWVNLVNVMLGLRLAWLRKVYRKLKIFYHISCTPCWISSLLGSVLINVWINLVNVMLGLRLAWLHKVYRKLKIFFHISCTPYWVSDLFDFTKYTSNSPFSPQTNKHSILFFFHKNCTLLKIASRFNALSDSLRCFLKIQHRFKVQHLNDSLSYH